MAGVRSLPGSSAVVIVVVVVVPVPPVVGISPAPPVVMRRRGGVAFPLPLLLRRLLPLLALFFRNLNVSSNFAIMKHRCRYSHLLLFVPYVVTMYLHDT